jgi:hypothetical protein
MTGHHWHHTAPGSSRTSRFSPFARAKASSDQSCQRTAGSAAGAEPARLRIANRLIENDLKRIRHVDDSTQTELLPDALLLEGGMPERGIRQR